MSRTVVVSNRLPALAEPGRPGPPEILAGGLASAVYAAVRGIRDSLWFGWSGRTETAGRTLCLEQRRSGGLDLVGMSLTPRDLADYYHGFCNGVLWPLFHCFQGRIRMSLAHEAGYRRVQARFAAALRPLLRPRDRVWVHDYHLLLLGRALRRLGWDGRIGFFLHIPFPPHELWQVLPDPRGFLEAMLEYDLVGFQTSGSLDGYVYSCRRLLGARLDAGVLSAGPRSQRVGVYPVGIDPRDFQSPPGSPGGRGRRGLLSRVVRGRRLILGVDRLDYTKGIPAKIEAYEDFLMRYPRWRKKVSFIQVASPTRTGAAHYQEQKRLVEAIVGRVNGEMAEHDWVPIRYLYRSYPRHLLARFYREASVGLVTPLRDGMNLVAKEFVAAQAPESPGVLVLSRCAGAAEDLHDAIIVNPFVPADVADGIERALAMTLEERRSRHQALLRHILASTVTDWGLRFMDDLVRGAGHGPSPPRPPGRAARIEPLTISDR